LRTVFKRISGANFKLQTDKSELLKKEIEYLGHVVTQVPETPKKIKSFLGLIEYYRKFIKKKFAKAKITKPLTKRLKGKQQIIIDEEYTKTFEYCKTLLCNDPLLRYPDFTKPFILTTDASNFAIGAVLSQGTMGSDRPLAFASRTLNEAEVNYSTVEKEMLAIVWGIKHFRPYLFGHKFTIVTDHRPLTWLIGFKEPNSKLVRWKLQLLEYDYEVTYKKRSQNVVADALSRIDLQVHNSDLESTQATRIK